MIYTFKLYFSFKGTEGRPALTDRSTLTQEAGARGIITVFVVSVLCCAGAHTALFMLVLYLYVTQD